MTLLDAPPVVPPRPVPDLPDQTPPAGTGADAARRTLTAAVFTIGLAVTALGLVELFAWLAHWPAPMRWHANDTPIRFNTALAVTLTGGVLLAGARRRAVFMRAVGAFDVALSLVVLAEHAFSWNSGIDQLVVHDFVAAPGTPPGRMAANTAVCFLAIGLAYLTWRPAKPVRRSALTAGAVVVAVVSSVAVFGYLFGVHAAYGWGELSAMALPTAVALSLLAAGLAVLGWLTPSGGPKVTAERVAVTVGFAAFAASGLLWQAFVKLGRGDTVQRSSASAVVFTVGALSAVLLAITTWLGQRANKQRSEALLLAARLEKEVSLRGDAEAVARENERLTAEFLEAMPVGVFMCDREGKPYFANRQGERLLGRGVSPHATGGSLSEVYHCYVRGSDVQYPNDRLPVMQALRGLVTHVDDIAIEDRSGQLTPVEVWGTPVYDADGSVKYGIAAFVDVTQRVDSEAAIEKQAALLDLAHDAIYVRNPARHITYWNQGAELLYGYAAAEAIGRDSLELLQSELSAPIEEIEAELARVGRWAGEVAQRDRAGTPLTVSSRWVAVAGDAGQLESILVINSDITERKAAELELAHRTAELERLNVDLQRSNSDLEQFAYAASHDLSEPLRAISGPISLLARRYDDQLDDDAKRFIEFTVDGCQRMQTLINDLLAFSRVGRLEGPMQDVDLNDVLSTVRVALQPSIDEACAEVSSERLPVVPGEATQLRQLLQNLVSNAIKFRGDVAPRVHITSARAASDWRVCVSDNGIGIDPTHRERIFGMFKRLHGREAYPGTGIGLALCKKIVERHGGHIGVDEGPDGVGSTFWFTLPATRESAV